MTIGKRIRTERERLGISQEELRIYCGISHRTQASYELGDSEPKVSYVLKMGELGADINYIITGNKPETILERVYDGVDPTLIEAIKTLMPAQQNEINEQIQMMREQNIKTYNFIKGKIEQTK